MAEGSDSPRYAAADPTARRLGRSAAMEIDPVCGMEVDPKTAEASWEYGGVTYYFCSRGCLADFREDPDSYLS
jgi:YHS domain-containing protein